MHRVSTIPVLLRLIFCDVTLCSLVDGYQNFRWNFGTLTWRWMQMVSRTCWYLSTTLGGITSQLKCDGTRAETRFRLSTKQTSPFKSAGWHQFSQLLTAEVCASAVVMLDTPCSEVVWRVLATHSIHQFAFTSPSHVSLCAIAFQLESVS